MPFYRKKWFEVFIALILFFILILLVSQTRFIFDPVFKYIGAIAVPMVGAGILYYVTKPLMHLFEKFKINRIVSIFLVFLTLILLVTLVVLYIAPIAQQQFTSLAKSMPYMVDQARELFHTWQANQNIIPSQFTDAVNDFIASIRSNLKLIVDYLFGFIGQLISFVVAVVFVPFFLFFMLKDGEKFVPSITRYFTKEKGDNIKRLLGKIDEALTAFIQGQVLVSVFLGIALYIGYLIIGLDYALTLALFGMAMNVIPFLGPFISVTPALIVGAFQDPIMIVWVIIVMIVAQQLESTFLSPNVMGRVLNLHPLTVITVILAAGSIAGFLGILFAVPAYAVIKTIVSHIYETYVNKQDNKKDALF